MHCILKYRRLHIQQKVGTLKLFNHYQATKLLGNMQPLTINLEVYHYTLANKDV